MGSEVIANCDCGLNENILIGGGMLNFTTTCLFPCYCDTCNNVVEVNLLSEDKKCLHCRSKAIISYDDPCMIKNDGDNIVASWNMEQKIGRELIITNGSYWCSKCKKPNLKFEDSGLCWD